MDDEPPSPQIPIFEVIDQRTPRRRAQQQQSPAGDLEDLAARIIHFTTGRQVVIQDDGSRNAMPDLRIEYPDRPPGYAEVVADMDPAYGLMWDKTIRASALPLSGADRVWHLTVTPACATRELRAALPRTLAALTSKGLTFDHHHGLQQLQRLDDHDVAALVLAGVVAIYSRPVRADERAEVSLGPEGVSGPLTAEWELVMDWLDEVLAAANLADVRSKLAATGATERHAVIGITSSSPGEAVFALSRWESSLPDRPPRLPEEITHLWLLGSFIDRHLAWYPEYGWFNSQRQLPKFNPENAR